MDVIEQAFWGTAYITWLGWYRYSSLLSRVSIKTNVESPHPPCFYTHSGESMLRLTNYNPLSPESPATGQEDSDITLWGYGEPGPSIET